MVVNDIRPGIDDVQIARIGGQPVGTTGGLVGLDIRGLDQPMVHQTHAAVAANLAKWQAGGMAHQIHWPEIWMRLAVVGFPKIGAKYVLFPSRAAGCT